MNSKNISKLGVAKKFVTLSFFLCAFILLSVSDSSANINLVVSSSNNKTIDAIDISNNTVLESFNQFVPVSLNYTNIKIDVRTNNTVTISNLDRAAKKMIDNETVVFAIIFVALILSVFCLAWLVKR